MTAATGVASAGQPLEAGVRDQLSSHFRHDFSRVRVHTGATADAAARALDAKAYTVGDDVVFSAGAYDPLNRSGRALIAHELAHVAQHGGRPHAASCLLRPGHAVPPASERLERQADLASRLHDRPLPRAWAWERASTPFVGRVPITWTPVAEPYDVPYAGQTRTIAEEHTDPSAPNAVRVNLGDIVLPAEKGPWADSYRRIATAGGLQAVTDLSTGRVRAGLWQKRAPSPELRRLWLLRVGWPSAQAARWWHEAGGEERTSFEPRVQGVAAQIDHVVELQLGGTNVPENLAPHNGPDNELSGRTIFDGVREASQAVADVVRRRPGRSGLNQVILHFTGAQQAGAYALPAAALPALPATEPQRQAAVDARKGQARSALQVHSTALADAAAGTRPSEADRAAAAAARGPTTPYPIAAGPSTATLLMPAVGAQPDLIEGSEIPENHAARELIAGMALQNLNRRTRPHSVRAWIDSPEHPPRPGTRLPISVPTPADKQLRLNVGDDGRLAIQGGAKQIRFTYPYLSTGRLTLRATERGIEGEGTLTPSVPLLRQVPITVRMAEGRFEGSVAIGDPSRLRLPPFRVTEASLNVTLAPELSASGRLAFALGSIVDGELTAGIDAGGFFANGTVRAHIPGLDRSEGRIDYRPGAGVSGYAVAAASGGTGLVRSGEVRVDFAGRDWSVSGRVGLMLPGNNPAELSVVKRPSGVVYTGRTTLTVPGLRPVQVELSYDGQHVSGTASTTFTVLGADGTMQLRYRDGRFSGEGSVALQRGRFSGRLDARLDERGRISGRGEGSLTIRPGLVGTVGVELSPEQQLRVTGEMRFPTYRIFEQRGNRYQLFSRNLPPIPLFAVPPGIALVMTIGGGLAADYSFGPGELREMVIRAAFNPLEEDTNLTLEAAARLVIPASAGVELSIRVGLGISAGGIATVSGGITVIGRLGVSGGLDASATVRYAAGIVVFDAEAAIRAAVLLGLRVEADIMLDTPVYSNRWPYTLARYEFDPGLEFGMAAPFHYASNEPFRLPSTSDIRWTVPEIDVGALTSAIGGRIRQGIGI